MTGKIPWWKSAVIYQIYPRSFCDSNADGIGDLPGILSRLDYLSALGVDALWLSPVYCSPQDDNGYDISDYQGIDPIFGSLDDMDRLIAEAGARGIRIVMDLVLNHSSDEHAWFRSARSSRESPYHDYYIWRDGDGIHPPDDMTASFGGSAWQWVPEVEQFYFHQFSVKQPDLNWSNPELRKELYRMIRWWADRGVGGFRLDVVDHLGKEPDRQIKVGGPMLHTYIREMSREAFQSDELVTVGEAWSADLEAAKQYSNPDGSELSMVFQFEHMKADRVPGEDKWKSAPLNLTRLRDSLYRWQTGLSGCGWNSLFWENHDLPRSVSRFGNDREFREESAKMLAILLFGMQGTVYLYQGEELGMTNAADYTLADYRDIEIRNMVREKRAAGETEQSILSAARSIGRDNARTPMQWDDGPGAGFTRGIPWIRLNPNYREINAEAQTGKAGSVLECYRELIRLRHSCPVLTEGSFVPLAEEYPQIFAYSRKAGESEIIVLCNFSAETRSDPLYEREQDGELLISSYPDGTMSAVLRPYEARMIRKETCRTERL